MEGGHVRPQGHGPADLLHGPGMIALLMVQHAEQVQGIGVVRFRCQHLLYSCAAEPSWPAWCMAIALDRTSCIRIAVNITNSR